MLIRISLIVALVASLAAAGLSFVKVKERIETTMKQRDDEKQAKEAAQRELASTKTKLKKTEDELTGTKTELANTKTELEAQTAKATENEGRANGLAATLETTKMERDTARQNLSRWELLGLTVDQVKQNVVDLKRTRTEREELALNLKTTTAKLNRAEARLNELIGDDRPVELPVGLKGKVIAVDPKYDFVVIDIGSNQGVLEKGQMLINRGGRMVAKVQITAVEANRSFANIIPGWKSDEPLEGDVVIH